MPEIFNLKRIKIVHDGGKNWMDELQNYLIQYRLLKQCLGKKPSSTLIQMKNQDNVAQCKYHCDESLQNAEQK